MRIGERGCELASGKFCRIDLMPTGSRPAHLTPATAGAEHMDVFPELPAHDRDRFHKVRIVGHNNRGKFFNGKQLFKLFGGHK